MSLRRWRGFAWWRNRLPCFSFSSFESKGNSYLRNPWYENENNWLEKSIRVEKEITSSYNANRTARFVAKLVGYFLNAGNFISLSNIELWSTIWKVGGERMSRYPARKVWGNFVENSSGLRDFKQKSVIRQNEQTWSFPTWQIIANNIIRPTSWISIRDKKIEERDWNWITQPTVFSLPVLSLSFQAIFVQFFNLFSLIGNADFFIFFLTTERIIILRENEPSSIFNVKFNSIRYEISGKDY